MLKGLMTKIKNQMKKENIKPKSVVKSITGKFILFMVGLAFLYMLAESHMLTAAASTLEEKLTHQCVGSIQREDIIEGTGITTKEAFNKFFGDGEWKYLYSEDGNIVQFNGKCKYMNKDIDCVIQYLVSPNKKQYEFYAMEFNGIPQNKLIYVSLIKAVESEVSGNKKINADNNQQQEEVTNMEYNPKDTIHNNDQCTPNYDGNTLQEASEQDGIDYENQESYD